MDTNSTIAAISTPAGMGALAVIRLSGPHAVSIASRVFKAKSGQSLEQQPHSTVRYGAIVDGQREVDEVMVSEGMLVSAGSPICTVRLTQNRDDLTGVFYIPVEKGKRVEPGMTIQLAPNGVDRDRASC